MRGTLRNTLPDNADKFEQFRGILDLRFSLLLLGTLPLLSQTPPGEAKASLADIHIVKKEPGKATGEAVVTVNNKLRRLAKDVYQVWPVMHGENALMLIRDSKAPAEGQARLEFVDGENRKHRNLGAVPFTEATLEERRLPNERMAFVLSGKAGSKPTIIVTDRNTVHAQLDNETHPVITHDTLTYQPANGGPPQTVSLQSLIGSDLHGIFEYSGGAAENVKFAQFEKDGFAYIVDRKDQPHKGKWRTDGHILTVREHDNKGKEIQTYHLSRDALKHIEGVPAVTHLTVRLLNPLSSLKADEGDQVDTVLISPAYLDGRIYLPQGTHFIGTITKVSSVGWAVPHETAALTIEFNTAILEDGTKLSIDARLYEVENSREKVNDKGSVQGVRSTGTLGHSAESKVASVAAFEPVAYLFTTVSATSVLGFAEPEILYNAGTELLVEFEAPLVTSRTYPPTSPSLANSPEAHQRLTNFVHKLTFRTMTQTSNKPSDITNLVFLGKADALRRAFHAAGWVAADELTANSTYLTMKSISGTQVYNEAPMSVLLLDERPPIFTLSKTTNTFNSRHHARIFDPLQQYDGMTAYTASSTQDIGIGFSAKQKTFIHIIDEYIDNERSKIVQDLQFTGCVQAAEYVDRPWVPKDAYNSTGDRLRTDGAAVVLKISSCEHPRTTSNENAVPPARFQRIVRDTVLTIRNDIIRGNLAYQGVSGTIWAHNYFAHRNDLKPNSGAWLKTDLSGENFKGKTIASVAEEDEEKPEERPEGEPPQIKTPDPEVVRARQSHRWDPPRYELGLQGGYLRYPSTRVEATFLLLNANNPGDPDYFTLLADQVDGGWSAGIYVIANTWKWFSNEFSYNYQRGKYEVADIEASGEGTDVSIDSARVGLITRQFEYNLLFNLRPPKSRWRPYVAVGPALQLISLDGAVLKKPSGPFRLGLQNIGVLKAAFDFGGTPPLEGGGIWQIGLQYGAGIRYRILPRFSMNFDFRETWAKSPDFIRDSYTADYFSDEFYNLQVTKVGSDSKFRQQRFTLGFAFTF